MINNDVTLWMASMYSTVFQKKLVYVTLISIVLFLMLFPVLVSSESDIPSMPERFYGQVYIDGDSADDGTVVSAWINGTEVESQQTYNGSYGYSTEFHVHGNNGYEVVFRVDGSRAATHYLTPGSISELDLAIIMDDSTDTSTDLTTGFSGGSKGSENIGGLYDLVLSGKGALKAEYDDNVLIREMVPGYVEDEMRTEYIFDRHSADLNPVREVEITSSGYAGSMVMVVEVLKDVSRRTSVPPGNIYSNLHIWAWNGCVVEDMIHNPIIHFSVKKSWLTEYDIQPDEIYLLEYHPTSETWQQAHTVYAEECENYYHFHAAAFRLSYYAIVSIDEDIYTEENVEINTEKTTPDYETIDPVIEDDSQSENLEIRAVVGSLGLGTIIFLTLLSMLSTIAVYGYAYKNME